MRVDMRFIQTPSVGALEHMARERILRAAASAIEHHGTFTLVLCGGSTPENIYRSLRDAVTPWWRWQIFFGDERCVPETAEDRNSHMAAEAWLDHVDIPRQNLHLIPAELGAAEGARRTNHLLSGVGPFDLVLLGLGEDGHTASLFPGHNWGTESDSDDALAVYDAPKPPKERVSLSARRLSHAREVLFLVHGEAKKRAVSAFRRRAADIPATAIQPEAGIDVLITSTLLMEP